MTPSRINSSQRTSGKKIEILTRELQRVKAELKEKEIVLENVLEGTMAGYWDWHVQNDTEYMSPTFKKMFGYEEDELPNKPESWQKIIHPDDLPGVFEVFEKHVSTKGEFPYDNVVRYHHKDGSIVWVYCRGKVIEWDSEGNPVRMVGSHVDITRLKEVEQSLREKTAELGRSNEELEQFAYVASHDLQEPLRKVRSFTERLSKKYGDQFDEGGREYLHCIVGGVARMQKLIQDLLSYSRFGRGQLKKTKTSLGSVVEKVISDLRPRIREAEAKVVVNNELPAVMVDQWQIIRLFQNLLSNSIKYRGARSPVVHIGSQVENGEVVLAVKDNGIGIDPEFWDRIFVIFQRLHGRADYEGTGVGLAICKKIVEKHGGRIWVDSEPGRGATFFFTLPESDSVEEYTDLPNAK